MSNVIDLFEITGQESGIVIYPDHGVIATNWNGQFGLPGVVEPLGVVYFRPDTDVVERLPDCADIRTVLPGIIMMDQIRGMSLFNMDILFDKENDIPALFGYPVKDGKSAMMRVNNEGNHIPTPGQVYRIGNAIVIAPDGWN